jgi:hypothetical protein
MFAEERLYVFLENVLVLLRLIFVKLLLADLEVLLCPERVGDSLE